MSLKRPRSYSGDLITSIVTRDSADSSMPSTSNSGRFPSYSKRRYKSKAKLAPKTRSAVRSIVRTELSRQLENKVSFYNNSVALCGQNIGASMNVFSVIPYINIAQGTGQQNRVGNEIRTKKLMYNFVIRPNAYDSIGTGGQPKPQDVIMMFGVVKNSKAITPTSIDFGKLWQEGSSSRGPFNSLADMCQTVNSDWFTVRKILRFKVGTAEYAGIGNLTSVNGQYYANNDYKYNHVRRLDLTSICPKTLRFNDITSQPTNDGLYCWAWCVPADGTIPVGTGPLQWEWNITYEFEDA